MKKLFMKVYIFVFLIMILFSNGVSMATPSGVMPGGIGGTSSGPQAGIDKTVCGAGIPVLFIVLAFVIIALTLCIGCAINFLSGNNKREKAFQNFGTDQIDQPPIPPTGGEARVQQPSGVTQTTRLSLGRNPIGRSPDNAICLDDPKVSKKHADLYLSEGRYTVTDLNSQNGTYVNGEKITQKDVYQGDQIQMGDSIIQV